MGMTLGRFGARTRACTDICPLACTTHNKKPKESQYPGRIKPVEPAGGVPRGGPTLSDPPRLERLRLPLPHANRRTVARPDHPVAHTTAAIPYRIRTSRFSWQEFSGRLLNLASEGVRRPPSMVQLVAPPPVVLHFRLDSHTGRRGCKTTRGLTSPQRTHPPSCLLTAHRP